MPGMSEPVERTVLFADLRGSTALYLRLGNTEAASVVTQSLNLLQQIVGHAGGRVIKKLGDGLMAVFAHPNEAVQAADEMHDSLERIVAVPDLLPQRTTAVKLKVALASGEMVEVEQDWFGDAVNVAARLLDLAGDNETLTTERVVLTLDSEARERFRSLDRLHLRGRREPVPVYRMEARRFGDTVSTQFEEARSTDMPDGLRLTWMDDSRVFAVDSPAIVFGRSPQATYCIDDSRVSRSHARVEYHGGHFQLTDLSYNGTFVRFAHEEQVITLRRGTCTLHGHGIISLGAAPGDHSAACVAFEVLSFSDTVPREDQD